MASLRMRLSLVILSLLFPVPHSFVIRKRSANYDFMTSNDLPSDWILERPQETIRDPYTGKYGALDGERLALELLLEHPEETYEDMDEDAPLEDRMRLLPEKEDGAGEDARVGGAAKLVDKSELEDLFEKATEMEKKTPEVDRGDGRSSSSKSELTREDVETLLSPAGSKGELRKIVTETKILVSASNGSDSTPSYEGVRVVEVAEKDSSGATRRQKQTEWLTAPDGQTNKNGGHGAAEEQPTGRGWLGDAVLGGQQAAGKPDDEGRTPSRKVKRSQMSSSDEVLVDEELPLDAEEVEKEAEDVELLKAYIRLQTEENRHLEKALNLAITTQVEDSDEYLSDEVGQLRLAVENEEALETIRDAIRGRQKNDDDDEGRLSRDDGEEEEEEGEEEEDGEEEEENGGGEEEEEQENEISRQLLKAKLKKFLIDSAVNDMRSDEEEGYGDDDDEEEEVQEDLAGQEDEDRGRPDQYNGGKTTVLNPFTRNAHVDSRTNKRRNPAGLSSEIDFDPDDLPRTTDDLDITDLLGTPDATELGYCPAVRELTDDCLVARADGLVLDAEAVSLCNRHQICYYCGSVFGMTSDSCDGGYLEESDQLCLGEEKCTKEAAGLYLIMAKTHQFIPSPKLAPYVCAAACVYDYVIGIADDRR